MRFLLLLLHRSVAEVQRVYPRAFGDQPFFAAPLLRHTHTVSAAACVLPPVELGAGCFPVIEKSREVVMPPRCTGMHGLELWPNRVLVSLGDRVFSPLVVIPSWCTVSASPRRSRRKS